MLQNMLDYVRITLYALLILVAFFLFQAWQHEHPPLDVTAVQTETSLESLAPAAPGVTTQQQATETTTQPVEQQTESAPQPVQGQLVSVKTDVLDVTIDSQGGEIVSTKLVNYPESLNSKSPFVLLNNNPRTRYIAESGLLSHQGPDTKSALASYSVANTNYDLATTDNKLTVPFVWQHDGLKVTKFFTFTRGSYEIKVTYLVENNSNQAWQGSLYTQLLRTENEPDSHSGIMNLTTFFGGAFSTPDKPFEKITFKQMREANLNKTSKDGWAAMMQHYFISAWIADKSTTSTYYTRVLKNGLYSIGMISSPLTVVPNAKGEVSAKLYAGPTISDYLEKAAPNLNLTIDYGMFWFLSVIIFWMMQKIYNVVGNWGWSIVLVTIVIKILFYQLSAKSYRSMSGLKALQPRIELLKERYADDKQKLTQATLELYKQEKVNPLSGCLPIVVQIPVFIALYWVLVESVQLRQAPFILWIHDLSQADPYYILPILMGISMFLQQRLNPPPPDPMQAKIMMFMPIIFTALFANFPAGLMLYWFVNNTLSFLQQWYIMHKLNKEMNSKKLQTT